MTMPVPKALAANSYPSIMLYAKNCMDYNGSLYNSRSRSVAVSIHLM